jgi:two-component system, chemotaxis family, sensor kinase CheA
METKNPTHPSDQQVIIVFQTASGPLAIPVDEILDRQQVVMKPLTGRLAQVRASYGCALLGNGDVALVLDCERLVQREGSA